MESKDVIGSVEGDSAIEKTFGLVLKGSAYTRRGSECGLTFDCVDNEQQQLERKLEVMCKCGASQCTFT